MKKIILASVSGIALLGLAACSDTDETTTQGIDGGAPATTTQEPAAAPDAGADAGGAAETESLAPAE